MKEAAGKLLELLANFRTGAAAPDGLMCNA